MAKNETVEKVKSLLEGHCYGPLKEAAEKWLAVADEKYGVKEKAGQAWDKLNEAAEKYSDASIKFGEKMGAVSDKIADTYESVSEKAGSAVDKLSDYAEKITGGTGSVADKLDDVGDKIGDAAERIATSELVKQLKAGISSVGDLIDTFGDKDAPEKFGEDFTEQMKAHAEELKAKGEKFCDCDACKKARSILKDFGEDIETFADTVEDKVEAAFDKDDKSDQE